VVARSSARTSTKASLVASSTQTWLNSQPVAPRLASISSFGLAAPVAGDPVPGALDAAPSELLDVEMKQLARSALLVAIRRIGLGKPRELAKPDPLQHR
jgi:hypothetical protein